MTAFDLAAFDEVRSAIADVADVYFVAAKDRYGERRGHAAGFAHFHAAIVNGNIGRVEHPCEGLAWRRLGFDFEKPPNGNFDRQLAGDFPFAVPADAVGNGRDGTTRLIFFRVVGFP